MQLTLPKIDQNATLAFFMTKIQLLLHAKSFATLFEKHSKHSIWEIFFSSLDLTDDFALCGNWKS